MQNFIITLLICSITMSALALLYMAATPLLAKALFCVGPLLRMADLCDWADHSLPA